MSTIEQLASPKSETSSEKAVFKTGTTLAKPRGMKRGITYKEIVLAFGILIAVVIAFTLWIGHPAETSSQSNIITIPSFPAAVKSVIKTATEIFF